MQHHDAVPPSFKPSGEIEGAFCLTHFNHVATNPEPLSAEGKRLEKKMAGTGIETVLRFNKIGHLETQSRDLVSRN